MGMKFVVPDVDKTFGKLYFGSCIEEVHASRNENSAIVKRRYSLFSERQNADNVEVEIPGSVPKKMIAYDEPVELVNPVIEASPRRIGDRFFTDYVMRADNIKVKEKK